MDFQKVTSELNNIFQNYINFSTVEQDDNIYLLIDFHGYGRKIVFNGHEEKILVCQMIIDFFQKYDVDTEYKLARINDGYFDFPSFDTHPYHNELSDFNLLQHIDDISELIKIAMVYLRYWAGEDAFSIVQEMLQHNLPDDVKLVFEPLDNDCTIKVYQFKYPIGEPIMQSNLPFAQITIENVSQKNVTQIWIEMLKLINTYDMEKDFTLLLASPLYHKSPKECYTIIRQKHELLLSIFNLQYNNDVLTRLNNFNEL